MSEPRIISPLLDGFALGESMSCHSGVNCYPAMRMDSDERYIVKTISVPASQTQLDALLLTGAFPDEEAARGYFKELTQGIRNEVHVLEKLSAQQGFLPFQGYQVVPLAEGVGFEVYLVSHYRQTLSRFLRRSSMTHLSAVNMGIDLCAALAACREAGYLYVGLKPSNIFLSGEQEYHIGDLGFVSLDSLKYASLPDRCRSNWIPPEVADAYATLNTTMDTYALGLVLYQVYNDGKLPFDSEESRQALMARLAQGEALDPPAYADYEMAQIILKACAYDPAQRWQDPSEMGHALITYMQRNGANNTLITVPPAPEPTPMVPAAEEENEPETETEELAAQEEVSAEDAAEDAPADEKGEVSEAEPESSWLDRMDAYLSEGREGEEADEDNKALRQILEEDDGDGADVDGEELSEETAGILSQADELIAHEAPEPAVAPEPIDIPMPEPIVLADEEEPAQDGEETAEEAGEEEQAEPEKEPEEAPEEEYYSSSAPKKGKKLLGWIITVLILALLGYGTYYGYTEYYLQEITDLTVTGEKDQMTVTVVTELDHSKLTVVCVDLYGNKQTAPVSGGSATFTGLAAGTQYNISLEVDGLHKLTGKTTAQHYTLPVATVSDFSAKTGPDDGSVILTFTPSGPEISSWTLEYAAEGQTPASVTFTGNTIIVSALVPGTEYTFTLLSNDEVELEGQTQLTFTASNVVYAQNLAITGNQDGNVIASWEAPEGVSVDSWTAKCYNENGFEQVLIVTQPTVTFTGVDPAASYTIEVTASGMTQSTRTYATANPITITSLEAEAFGRSSISLTWTYDGAAPAEGWLVLYSVDDSTEQHVIQCSEPVAVIEPVAPGSHYDITIQAANVSVFGGTTSVDVEKGGSFSAYGLSASQIDVTLCKAPSFDGWDYSDVPNADKVSTFAVGQNAALLLQTTATYNIDYTNVITTYVVRDADGKLACVSTSTDTWDGMWLAGHCDLQIPTLPTAAGSYTLELYFDGALVTTLELTIQ